MLVNTFTYNLNNNLERLSSLQIQMSQIEHSKYAHISDDPISLIYSQQAREKLRKVADYKSNVETAQSWMVSVETGLSEMNTIMVDAYHRVIQASTDVMTDYDRQNMSEEMKQLRDHLLSTHNMTQGDLFIYGGYNTTGHTDNGKVVAPFDFAYYDATGSVIMSSVTGRPITTEEAETTLYLSRIDHMDLQFNSDVFVLADTQDYTDGTPIDTMAQPYANDVVTLDVGMFSDLQLSFSGTQIAVYGYEKKYAQTIPAASLGGTAIPLTIPGAPTGTTYTFNDTTDPKEITATTAGVSSVVYTIDKYNIIHDATDNVVGTYFVAPSGDATIQITGIGNDTPKTMVGLVDKTYRALSNEGNWEDYVDPSDGLTKKKYIQGSTASDINVFINEFQEAQNHVLSLIATVGGRTNRLDLLETRYESDRLNYTEMMSNAEDADEAELIMQFKMAEATYKAALSTGSYIIQPTLMDYLR
jgi:flagellar hook-associated protein 3 FlgL